MSITRTVNQTIDLTVHVIGDKEMATQKAQELADEDGLHWNNEDVTYVSVDWVQEVK